MNKKIAIVLILACVFSAFGFDETIEVSAKTKIGKVKNFTFEYTSVDGLRLNWSKYKKADGYQIYRDGRKIKTIKTKKSKKAYTYKDKKFDVNVNDKYLVKAYEVAKSKGKKVKKVIAKSQTISFQKEYYGAGVKDEFPLVDENEQELSGEKKARAEQLKALRAEIAAMEKKVNAERTALDTAMNNMKIQANSQLENYRFQLNILLYLADKESAKATAITQLMNELEKSWDTAINLMATNLVKISESTEDITGLVSPIWGFKGFDSEKMVITAYTEDAEKYQAILAAQNILVNKQRSLKKSEDQLLAKQQEYNKIIMQ